MPRRPLRPCAQPGCPTLVEKGYCPAHQRPSRSQTPEQRKFYSSSLWRRTSLMVRSEQPICADCEKAPSETVDHLNGWQDNRREMLRGLCWACHNRKSGGQHARRK